MKRILYIIPCLLLMISCHTTQEYAYLSDVERDSAMQIITTYASTIHPGDQLYIYVSSTVPESVIPFNQETNKLAAAVARRSGASGLTVHDRQRVQTGDIAIKEQKVSVECYTVKTDGTIDFPVLGVVSVAGVTLDSLSTMLQNKIKEGGYVSDPSVEVKMINFRVAVIGEVNVPQEIHLEGERLTIFEALAMCHDITMYGRRDNVKVAREENGKLQTYVLDMQSKEILDSPCYYLQQNDIVYVEPNDLKKKRASRDENIPRYISMGVSGATTLVNVWRIMMQINRYNR